MALTKTNNSDVFNEFYDEMKSGAMVAPSYELTFTEKTTNATYKFTGTWSGKNMITLRTGQYYVYGKSEALGENIQDKCSIIIDDNIIVDTDKTSITLKASYDCSLVVFSDASISSLSNFNGHESKPFFKFKTYYYAFVKSTLYNSSNKDKAYIEGTRKDNSSFNVFTGNLSFEKGKYYIYNNVATDFDLPPMDEGDYDSEEYEWVTLSESILGTYTNSTNEKFYILDNKFYLKKIRIDKTQKALNNNIQYIRVLFLSDDNPNFSAFWSQYRKTDIEYGFGGLSSDYYPIGEGGSNALRNYGTNISENIIEFDLSQFADKTYIWGYQTNVNLSGIQAYVLKK